MLLLPSLKEHWYCRHTFEPCSTKHNALPFHENHCYDLLFFTEIPNIYWCQRRKLEYEMVVKLLITITVIFAAYLILKRRHISDSNSAQPSKSSSKPNTDDRLRNDFTADLRFGAYLFLIMMLSLSAGMGYVSWKSNHEKVLVTLYRKQNTDAENEKIVFYVYRQDLLERSFTTVDGIKVVVASDERMEIRDL